MAFSHRVFCQCQRAGRALGLLYPQDFRWTFHLSDAPWFHVQGAQESTASHPQVGRLNHVAIAVPDLQKAAERYRSVLGAQVSEIQDVPEHGVSVVFVSLPNTKLELLHPLGDKSPIAGFLQKNPSGGLHHICLEVGDIQGSLDHVSKHMRVLDPVPKIGAHGNPVAFLHPKDNDGVLTELEEVR
eukprot:jgi/Botrbrau1/10329/Bobra.0321s0007.1